MRMRSNSRGNRYNGGMALTTPRPITRRHLAALVAAVPVAAQAPARFEGDADLEDARQLARDNYQLIQRVKLPMTVEPATQFKA
jgi:hypothetical protein